MDLFEDNFIESCEQGQPYAAKISDLLPVLILVLILLTYLVPVH